MILKPMLAATIESPEDFDKIDFPVYASPKLDGVRCVVDSEGVPHSRKGLLFDNSSFTKSFPKRWRGLDGEIIIGSPTDEATFNFTSGWLRQKNNPVALQSTIDFHVFDCIAEDMTFDERWQKNKVEQQQIGNYRLIWVPQILCISVEEIQKLEDQWVKLGYEGVCLRGGLHTKPYKHGRASMRSQELMKYKRFITTEGKIIGFIEQETNTNEKQHDAFGNSKRSSSQTGKVPNGRVGKIILDVPRFAKPVTIGTGKGLTNDLRTSMWSNQQSYIGRTVTFAYQPTGGYELPRVGSFKEFRDDGI